MVDVTYILLAVSLILFLGYFAEFMFKRFNVPDILFLIILGFIIGPVLNYVTPYQLSSIAPFFTAFALLFLLYDGAFNIDLASFAKGLSVSMGITLFNFFASVIVIATTLVLFRFSLPTAILTGFMLSGISSAFVIPILKQMNVKGEIYSVLTIESALTDVFCIVFSFTTIEIIKLNTFNMQIVSSQIATLFAVAGLVGIVGGIVWIIIVANVLKHNKSYMATIAYLLLIYVITEYLKGNGAIAALFFGLILKNSKQLTSIFQSIVAKKEEQKDTETLNYGISVTTPTEQLFYSQISFFLKTFFFVYIGILFNLKNITAIIFGVIISILIMFSRNLSVIVTRKFNKLDRELVSAIFGPGLASAVVAQVVIEKNIENAQLISSLTYSVIIFTILLSSIRIFLLKKKMSEQKQSVSQI